MNRSYIYQSFNPSLGCWQYFEDNSGIALVSGSHYLPKVPILNPAGYRCPCIRADDYPSPCQYCKDYKSRPIGLKDLPSIISEAEDILRGVKVVDRP